MGPSIATKTKEFPYYDKVRTPRTLHSAWRKVYSNGIRSKSPETRNQVKEFSDQAFRYLEQIYRQLLKDKFKFELAKGALLRNPRKKLPRPIVIAPIKNRIVQRSILDILQAERSIYKYVNTPFSFGGIKDYDEPKGVHTAVKAAQKAIAEGAKWYIQSDIKNFFTNIPSLIVVDIISSFISDKKFIELFKAAIDVELENMAELGKKAELFPIYEVGVAQGCCLSPLIGNIILHDFDTQMNGRGIVCLRYIDDFIILAPTNKKAEAAFKNGLTVLESLGLDAYEPHKDKDKAHSGQTANGIDFLGCEILGEQIKPNKKSRDNLLTKIDTIISESKQLMDKPAICCENKRSFVDTLESINNILEGWGNQYFYCNDKMTMEKLDHKIDERLRKYFAYYGTCLKSCRVEDFVSKRRLLGVHLLLDSFQRNQDKLLQEKKTVG